MNEAGQTGSESLPAEHCQALDLARTLAAIDFSSLQASVGPQASEGPTGGDRLRLALAGLAGSGLVALCLTIAHVMMRTQEEHLHRAYGAAHERYCARTPWYLGPPAWR